MEFKRQATARGTPEETTKSKVKFDYFPDGPVSLLRLELPFPDEDTDFEGRPFNPRPGDLKVRVGMRPVQCGAFRSPRSSSSPFRRRIRSRWAAASTS